MRNSHFEHLLVHAIQGCREVKGVPYFTECAVSSGKGGHQARGLIFGIRPWLRLTRLLSTVALRNSW